MATPRVVACRWDWCPSSFATIEALETHVKHAHIWPMKPMRKADIADMRRMDLQCLHSSFSDSSIISRGRPTGVARNKTPPAVPPTSAPKKRAPFDTFTQLSSPPRAQSPHGLPASPAFEGLMKQDGHSGLSAAVELFERAYTHKKDHRVRFFHSRSPTRRPLSESSGSSQEVVEQQLTQEDDAGPLPLSQPQIEDEADPELRWPTDDESDVIVAQGIQVSPPVSKEIDSARGRNFRHGSLNVPLDVNSNGASSLASQGSHGESQPVVLQSQAPYSSQAMGWS